MLLLGSDLDADGLTVYRDHISPRTFHYLPAAPHFTLIDGTPGIGLIRYRGVREGGFLSLDVTLHPDAALLARAHAALTRRFGDPVDLVPVLLAEASVRLTALDAEDTEPRLVERVIGTARPSLSGDARAVFSLTLTREAATLVEAALRTGTAPVAIVYDLTYDGLHPARGLRIRLAYEMSYNYLRARAGVNTLWFKADLDREIEALRRDGHLEIEDVDYGATATDPDTMAARAAEVQALLRDLAATLFFQPAASPATFGAATASHAVIDARWALGGRPQAAFVLRGLEQHEEQTLAYDMTRTTVRRSRVGPQGQLRLPPGLGFDRVVREMDIDENPVLVTVHAFAFDEADWSGVASVTVDVRNGTDVASMVIGPAARDATVMLRPGTLEWRLRVISVDEPDALGAPSPVEPAWAPLALTQIVVDPQTLAARRSVRFALGFVDASAIRQVQGHATLGDRTVDFLLTADKPERTFVVRGASPFAVEAQMIAPDGTATPVSRTIGAAESVVLFNQPTDRALTVTVMLQDPFDRYDAVFVELQAGSGTARRAVRLDRSAPTTTWSTTLGAGSPRTYQYKVRRVGKDASVVDTEWQGASGSLLVVGDVSVRVETIDVILVEPAASSALVRLTSLDPPAGMPPASELFFDVGQTEMTASLPFARAAARRYRVEATLFGDTGQTTVPPFDSTDEVLLLHAQSP